MEKINFAFWGTGKISKETIDILFQNSYVPKIIITTEDKRSGRGMQINESELSIWAKEHNVTCLKPTKIDNDFIEEFKKYNIDLSIVVAYGKILPKEIIDLPSLGTINIHYSLLPKWRGASPIESALLNNEEKTGISIQQMVFRLDSGPIIAEKELSIDINDTKDILRNNLILEGGQLLVKVLPNIIKKDITPTPQDESKATYCKKIKKEDGEINPNGNPKENWSKYRAYFGWPGVFFFKNGKRIKITKAKYENDSFIIERVIPEGKKETDFKNINF
jgi:methionyl-tRNA formyltransferase